MKSSALIIQKARNGFLVSEAHSQQAWTDMASMTVALTIEQVTTILEEHFTAPAPEAPAPVVPASTVAADLASVAAEIEGKVQP